MFVGRAGEQGAGAEAAVPATGQAEQAAVDERGGEVFLGDADLAVLPALADVIQVGQQDFADHSRCGEILSSVSRAWSAVVSS